MQHPDFVLTNAERSAFEVVAFKADKPGPYFAYYTRDLGRIRRGCLITTWMGDKLAVIESVGRDWTSNMGDVRQSFRARGINGVTYSGTAFLSAGYVRMRPVKA